MVSDIFQAKCTLIAASQIAAFPVCLCFVCGTSISLAITSESSNCFFCKTKPTTGFILSDQLLTIQGVLYEFVMNQ